MNKVLDAQHVADEVRENSDKATRENAAWTIEQLMRQIAGLRRWCKKEEKAARSDGQGREITDSNRARAFGRMDAFSWTVNELDRRFPTKNHRSCK